LPTGHCRAVPLVNRPEQLEAGAGKLRPERPCCLDKLENALVAKQPAEEQEGRRTFRDGRWREAFEIHSRPRHEARLLRSDHAPLNEQLAIVSVLKEDDGRAPKADLVEPADDLLDRSAADEGRPEAADVG